MSSDKYVLTRPIEVTALNDDFRVDYNGAGWSNLTMEQGVYGSIATYLHRFEAQLKTVDAGFSVSLTADFYVKVEHSTNTFEIDWVETGVGAVMGFDADCTPVAQSFTATQIPLYCWFPDRIRADQNPWEPNHKENYSGDSAISGIVSGLSTGKVLYTTTVKMTHQPPHTIRWTRCRSAAEQLRCLDEFLAGARTSYPSSGNVRTGGFYFWPDYTECQPLASMDEGDVSTFEFTSSADVYAFCEFDPNAEVKMTPSLRTGRVHYSVDLPIRTSTYPTGGWSAPT